MSNIVLMTELSNRRDLPGHELSDRELDDVSGGLLPALAAAGVGAVGQGMVIGFAILGAAVVGYGIYKFATT